LEDATHVASALERYAFEYKQNIDAPHFLRSRKIVVNYFLRHLDPGSKVLDINCGTGIDVVEIAKRGHRVMGVDISSTMISFATENIVKSGMASTAHVEVCDYRDLPEYGGPFDAVLSNFGGVNFVEDLGPIFSSVDRNLKDGGILVINSVSHFCLMESAIFLFSGNFSKAFRRLAGGKARIGGKWVQLFYHRKNALVDAGAKFGYSLIDIFGLNILTPPLWANDFFAAHKKIGTRLEIIDDGLRRVPVLRTIGDFMVVVFRKGAVAHNDGKRHVNS
jgi:ubiquinone/menaquinone biosynthesis C-methylase UbiE